MSSFLKNANNRKTNDDDEEDQDNESDVDSDSDYESSPKPKIKILGDTTLKIDNDEEDDNPDSDIDDDDADNDNDNENHMESVFTNKPQANDHEAEIKRRLQLDDVSDSDADSDDDSDDDNYLQKFDENIQRDVIQEYHPEMILHNYQEVETMVKTTRDENGIIIDPLHRTNPFITRYEYARVLGERAKQINAGAKPFVKLEEGLIDGYLIALQEYREKKIPFIIKRPLPNGGCEYWSLKDLENIV